MVNGNRRVPSAQGKKPKENLGGNGDKRRKGERETSPIIFPGGDFLPVLKP